MRVDCQLDSLWPAVEETDPRAGNLPRRADVCVVGAGMAGLCVAYQLCRAGKRVVVMDPAGVDPCLYRFEWRRRIEQA